jgi:cell division septum initiation protein DivIVA
MRQPPFTPALSDDDRPAAFRSGETTTVDTPSVNQLSHPQQSWNNHPNVGSETHIVELLSEFSRFEELLLNSPRLPLTGKTMVGEDEVLEQMDFIRSNLPTALQTAQDILQHRDSIIRMAEQQAQQHLATAQQQAFQIANELGIVDRAKTEAYHMRQIAQAECDQMRQQTIFELEQFRAQYAQDIEQLRQQSIAECQKIQREADAYADQVLQGLEENLSELHAKIRRGRQHLNPSLSNSVHPH